MYEAWASEYAAERVRARRAEASVRRLLRGDRKVVHGGRDGPAPVADSAVCGCAIAGAC